jgi:hypothetical protein
MIAVCDTSILVSHTVCWVAPCVSEQEAAGRGCGGRGRREWRGQPRDCACAQGRAGRNDRRDDRRRVRDVPLHLWHLLAGTPFTPEPGRERYVLTQAMHDRPPLPPASCCPPGVASWPTAGPPGARTLSCGHPSHAVACMHRSTLRRT